MEPILRQALHPDPLIRLPAEESLRNSEKLSGFLTHLLQFADSSPDQNLKIFALILSKSVINRQWHLNYIEFQIGGISADEKNWAKIFLMQKIFLNECGPELISHYIMCLISISKFDFYDTWPELVLYFNEKIKNLNEIDVKVLKCLVKTQIRKRTKFRQFRDWVLSLYPFLRPLWRVHSNVDFDKIIVKCLTVKSDPELILELLGVCKELLTYQDGENRLRVLLKGINLVENIFPAMFSGKILEVYLEVNYTIITNIDLNSDIFFSIIRQVVYNIRQILETNEEAQQLLKPFSLPMLQKTANSFKKYPNLEDWISNDYISVLSSKKEENCIKKLSVTLATLYPDLKVFIYELMESLQSMQFDQLLISLTLISLLTKVHKNTQSEELKPEILVLKVSSMSLEGIFSKVIWRELLKIVRKSMGFVKDFPYIFNTLSRVKESAGEDLVIIYESCLTAKEMLNYNIGEDMRAKIIEEFEPIRFEIKEKIENF